MPEQQLSVSELNQQVKLLLEYSFAEVAVFGEISGFTNYRRSGHWYFAIKDDRAQVQCAMFAGDNAKCSMQPADGAQVLLRGRVSLYSPRGNYQFICKSMEPLGLGRLMQQFLQLKQRFLQEGLFGPERKQQLPPVESIRRIAVVTSKQGAAVQDVLKVLRSRMPTVQVSVVDTLVQGASAAAKIAQALSYADSLRPDVLLLTRGGGSLEDLWCFNEEAVVRALVDCRSCTVSAIGHETDQSLCDFVADATAPTPSAAAALLSPVRAQLLADLANKTQRINNSLRAILDECWQRLDYWEQRLRANHPTSQLARASSKLDSLQQRLTHAMLRQLGQQRHKLDLLSNKLDQLNPQTVLQRGYSLVYDDQGQLLSAASASAVGAKLRVKLKEGALRTEVLDIEQ